jgi:hypothetical protein
MEVIKDDKIGGEGDCQADTKRTVFYIVPVSSKMVTGPSLVNDTDIIRSKTPGPDCDSTTGEGFRQSVYEIARTHRMFRPLKPAGFHVSSLNGG